MKSRVDPLDAIVVGGGPAGLSAGLLLGRCRRTVTLFDDGKPRNSRATEVHAYLGLEDASPADLIETGRRQVSRHPNVTLRDERVTSIRHAGRSFQVTVQSGMEFRSRGLILATGLIDQLPRIKNLEEFYGKTIHVCPYCDGWESADQEIGVWGGGNDGTEVALEMLLWSATISLFVDGPQPDDEIMERLRRSGVAVYSTQSATAIGNEGMLEALELADGRVIPCRRLFLAAPQTQPNSFIEDLGCGLNSGAQAECEGDGVTRVEGLFIAGNAANGIELSMVAAAEGLKAAASLNDWLLAQDSNRS